MNGKGSTQRPTDMVRYGHNYDAVFRNNNSVVEVHESITLFDLTDRFCTVCKDTGLVYTVGVAHDCKCQQ